MTVVFDFSFLLAEADLAFSSFFAVDSVVLDALVATSDLTFIPSPEGLASVFGNSFVRRHEYMALPDHVPSVMDSYEANQENDNSAPTNPSTCVGKELTT